MGAVCCGPCIEAKQTLETMNKTINVIRGITDESQVIINDVKGFVGSVKEKTEDLERLLVEDVKGVMLEIRSILDTIPKIPEVPELPTSSEFSIADYIPFPIGLNTAPPQSNTNGSNQRSSVSSNTPEAVPEAVYTNEPREDNNRSQEKKPLLMSAISNNARRNTQSANFI